MSELQTDPRTGLAIIDVPPQHGKYFSDIRGSILHWFGVVDKYNRMWKPQKRVCMITDACIYLCVLDGAINRCLQIQNVVEVILSEQTAIGFRVASPDYDMLISVETVQDREAIVHIAQKVYWSTMAQELVVRRLAGEQGEAMQQNLNLTKPKDWSLQVAPIKSVKTLSKMIREREKKEKEDRRVVEEEFARIKAGLKAELQQYKSEEYDQMLDKLSQYVKAVEEKDRQIAKLKENTVSLDDPEVWKKCPNCAQLRKALNSHPNDDKQKILRLEREIESQRHIMEHLQAAIQHRSIGAGAHGDGSGVGSKEAAQLRQDLHDAQQRNRELQQLIIDSPYITTDMKQKAQRLSTHTRTTGVERDDLTDTKTLIEAKNREIRHLKSVLKDTTFRQVQELESIRSQFKQYDEQMLAYLEKVFAGSIQPPTIDPCTGGRATAYQQAEATVDAAKAAIQDPSPLRSAASPASRYDSFAQQSPAYAQAYDADPPAPPHHEFSVPYSATPQRNFTIANTPQTAAQSVSPAHNASAALSPFALRGKRS